MPIYEYLCNKCNLLIEEKHSFEDIPDKIKCKCGSYAKKQISKCNWVLKGSGDSWPSQQLKRKNEMTRNNIIAGDRGRGEWKKRMPKLIYK